MKVSDKSYYNQKVRITASAIGVFLGLAGILNHGIFEILQGNTPTYGFYIEAIGENHRYWLYGTEGAFTVVHNFLITGICTVIIGLTIIIWSLKYIHTRYGTKVFLSLLIIQTLVGGGLGHLILFIPTWAFATRINKPLKGWERVLSLPVRKKLNALWVYLLATTLISWLFVMELGIFGYVPGLQDPEAIINTVFVFLFATVILACISFVGAIAGDLQGRTQ